MSFEISTGNFHLKFGKQSAESNKSGKSAVPPASVKIEQKDYTYAPLRVALLPTPLQLKQAVITILGDPRPMFDILRKLPIADMHLAGVLQKRKDAIMGFEWRVKPADINAEDPVEQKRADEINNRLVKSNFKDFLKCMDNGIIFGHSVSQLHWMLDSNNQYMPNFESIDYIHFSKKDKKLQLIVDRTNYEYFMTIGQDNSPLVTNVDQYSVARYLNNNAGIMYLPINEDQVITMMNNPFEGLISDYIGGLIRPALYLTLLKYYNLLDWAKFNELFGMPLRVGKFDPLLSSDAAINTLKTAVQNLGTDASAVIDTTTMIEFVESKGGNSNNNPYQTFADYIETKQSILMLGQNLTTQIGKGVGSKAAATVHQDSEKDKIWTDCGDIKPRVDKVVDKDYFYNYGMPANNAYPEFEFITEEYKDLQGMAAVVRDLASSGKQFSSEWADDYFGTVGPEDQAPSFGGNKNPFGGL
jgi:phage gp29-like protein